MDLLPLKHLTLKEPAAAGEGNGNGDSSNNNAQHEGIGVAATEALELMTLPPEVEDDDVRVAMIGNVDSGKSTLIGVLTHAALDDGRGSARKLVLKHRHEQENGRTSAVTVELMGWSDSGEQVGGCVGGVGGWG